MYNISIVYIWITWSVHKRSELFPFFVLCILWFMCSWIFWKNIDKQTEDLHILKKDLHTFQNVPLDHVICSWIKGNCPLWSRGILGVRSTKPKLNTIHCRLWKSNEWSFVWLVNILSLYLDHVIYSQMFWIICLPCALYFVTRLHIF